MAPALRVASFGIKSREELFQDVLDAEKAVRNGLPFKPRKGVFFSSIEAMRNFLTPKRLELLHKIKETKPHSIYRLAKIVGRGFPSVLRDVELLVRHGLVKLPRDKKSKRQARQPTVRYDAINVWIEI